MPNNFSGHGSERRYHRAMERCGRQVERYVERLLAGQARIRGRHSAWMGVLQRAPYKLFYKRMRDLMGVDEDKCTRCGLCASLCPMGQYQSRGQGRIPRTLRKLHALPCNLPREGDHFHGQNRRTLRAARQAFQDKHIQIICLTIRKRKAYERQENLLPRTAEARTEYWPFTGQKKLGMEPVSLITTYNTDRGRSWFHGVPERVLSEVSGSLDVPVRLIKTSGEKYALNFEKELALQKQAGAQVVVFGDIDLEPHRQWCTERCRTAGVEAFFPLWQEDRATLVYEFLESGFEARITVVDTAQLDRRHLGEMLTEERAELIRAEGADICGENGEYHTFVFNGPIFERPVTTEFGDPFMYEQYAILPMK